MAVIPLPDRADDPVPRWLRNDHDRVAALVRRRTDSDPYGHPVWELVVALLVACDDLDRAPDDARLAARALTLARCIVAELPRLPAPPSSSPPSQVLPAAGGLDTPRTLLRDHMLSLWTMLTGPDGRVPPQRLSRTLVALTRLLAAWPADVPTTPGRDR